MGAQPQLCFHGLTRLVEQLWKREGGREEVQVDKYSTVYAFTTKQNIILYSIHHRKLHMLGITGTMHTGIINMKNKIQY